jgi:hypothetical protein
MNVKLTPGGHFVRSDLPNTCDLIVNTTKITKYPARVAHGARKPRTICPGGAASTSTIVRASSRNTLLGYAARGK